MWHPKKNLDPFLPVFTHFFMSSSGPRSKISKKGNSMICLNMVQQPPRLEVASGPFKHLGQGVQLRLWLWIAVYTKLFFCPLILLWKNIFLQNCDYPFCSDQSKSIKVERYEKRLSLGDLVIGPFHVYRYVYLKL